MHREEGEAENATINRLSQVPSERVRQCTQGKGGIAMRGTWGDLFVCVEDSRPRKRVIYQAGDWDLKVMLTREGNEMK